MKNVNQNNVLKYLNAELLIETAKHFNDIETTEDNVLAVTENYGIYGNTSKNDKLYIGYSIESLDNYRVLGFTTIRTVLALSEKLLEAVKQPAFFGAIVLCGIKGEEKLIPYNPLSLNFITLLEKGVLSSITKVFLYFVDNQSISNVDTIAESIEKSYSNMSYINFKIEDKKQNPSINLMADRESNLEALGFHLDQLHRTIKYQENDEDLLNFIMATDYYQVQNSDVSDSIGITEENLPSSWCIELHTIQSGIVTPTYGLWGKRNNKVVPIAPITTMHPNVSSNGNSYCTGINMYNSIKGISELSYGNLNSPLNSNIGLSNSLSVAKAYQKVMLPLLLNTKIGE